MREYTIERGDIKSGAAKLKAGKTVLSVIFHDPIEGDYALACRSFGPKLSMTEQTPTGFAATIDKAHGADLEVEWCASPTLPASVMSEEMWPNNTPE